MENSPGETEKESSGQQPSTSSTFEASKSMVSELALNTNKRKRTSRLSSKMVNDISDTKLKVNDNIHSAMISDTSFELAKNICKINKAKLLNIIGNAGTSELQNTDNVANCDTKLSKNIDATENDPLERDCVHNTSKQKFPKDNKNNQSAKSRFAVTKGNNKNAQVEELICDTKTKDNLDSLPTKAKRDAKPTNGEINKIHEVLNAPRRKRNLETESIKQTNKTNHSPLKDKLDTVHKFMPFTSTPKKRGRKSANNGVLKEDLDTPDISFVKSEVINASGRQSGRKRKVVNYTFDECDDATFKKKQSKLCVETMTGAVSASRSERIKVKEELVETNTDSSQGFSTIASQDKKFKNKNQAKILSESIEHSATRRGNKKLKPNENFSSTVTCAVCNEEVTNTNWNSHLLRRHNNLAWRVGESPLDLNDQKLVLRILTSIYKKKLPFHCDVCGEVKKSVGGLLSHKTLCKKSAQEVMALRVKCDACGRSVLPVSVSAHMRVCKAANPHLVGNSVTSQDNNKSLILNKGKRGAAVKADNLIQSFAQDNSDSNDYWQAWFKNKQFWLSPELLTRIRNDIDRYGSEKCDVGGCDFESDNSVSFAQHYQTCIINSEEELCVCKYCVTVCYSEKKIVAHIKSSHQVKKRTDGNFEVLEIGEETDETGSGVAIELKKWVPPHAVRLTVGSIAFLLQNRYCTAATNIVYPPASDWTMKFCQQHFSTLNLFSAWKVPVNDYKSLDTDMVHSYLPPLRYSASVNRISTETFIDAVRQTHSWKKYKLFEAELLDDGTVAIFCGGQIFAMAWLPTPFDKENIHQILAVCTSSSSMDKQFTLNEVYCETDLIQFWNFGMLKNNEHLNNVPKLEFCIAHDYGPVRYLEWCPSGCYDCEPGQGYLSRLGLLAVGCTNSYIYLYSISCPAPKSGKIFKPKPVLKLLIDSVLDESACGMEAHVTKISWSKVSGHQLIAAGYANGFVAIFNLSTTSSLLKLELDASGVQIIMPYRVFKAHFHAVSALHLYHLSDGRRWLMTGSTDRTIKYWDLENLAAPVSNFYKATVNDGVWISHWLSSVHSFDDCCGSAPTTSTLYQPRNFISEHAPVMYSNCHIWSISGSEWTNGFIQGNVMGELQAYFPHQLFAGMDNDKSKSKKKVMLGYVNIVEKDLSVQERIAASVKQKISPKSISTADSLTDISEMNNVTHLIKTEPLNYKEAADKYGVVFCDVKVKSLKQCSVNMNNYIQSNPSKYYNPQPNMYPLQSINKVAFNPNCSSFLYVAAAYQIGFVRVSSLEFLNK